ncbi:GntR family transcriptional regulator [Actinosynnema sp. NPDC023587]|uniref:GntR family transcriptional regulator n=1 Tax=Actinosynnema sp. NPDC023587 TaxID=3154695 RepID=UPI00340D01C0
MSTQGEPASRKVARELRLKIENGSLPPGSQLPSERTIASQYEIARTTATEAIRLLEQEGLVVRMHGKGNFVRSEKPLIRLGGDRYSKKFRGGPTPFRRECEKAGLTPRIEVLAVDRAQPPEDIAALLRVDSGSKSTLRRSNHYFANDEPLQVVTTYIPWVIAEGTALTQRKQVGKDGIYGRLEERGHLMMTISEEVTSRMPDVIEKELLQIPAGTPVLEVLHTSFDQDKVPFEATRFVLRGDRNGLLYQLSVD